MYAGEHNLLCLAHQGALYVGKDIVNGTASTASPGYGGDAECTAIVTTILNFDCRSRPRVSVIPETAVVKNTWNAETGRQELQLIHHKDTESAVIVELSH